MITASYDNVFIFNNFSNAVFGQKLLYTFNYPVSIHDNQCLDIEHRISTSWHILNTRWPNSNFLIILTQ